MAFWLDIAAFLVKALIIVAAVGGLAVLIARLARSGEAKDKEIKVKSLNERYDDMRDAMDGALLDKKERKALARARKKEDKAAAKARRGQEPGKRIYVLGFKGDMRATAVKRLGSEIDAVLIAARPGADEAVIRIESPGGTVTGYGLAAAEILRLRQHKIRVTASVDQVAASGGYMMACAADRIVAAPFAVVGSIGVVAPVPNLHRLLKKNEIEFEEMTAGEFKRTVSVLGEITPEGREHFRGKLDATHEAFKAHVQECRPNMDMAKVANGDHWLAREAIGLGLVDELMTGDELLFRARDERAPLRGLDRSAQDAAAAAARRARRGGAARGGRDGGEADLEQIVFGSNHARHCERSEAIQERPCSLDCFVAALLAMTIPPKATRLSLSFPTTAKRAIGNPGRLLIAGQTFSPAGMTVGARSCVDQCSS